MHLLQTILLGSPLPHSLSDSSPQDILSAYSPTIDIRSIPVTKELVLGHLKRQNNKQKQAKGSKPRKKRRKNPNIGVCQGIAFRGLSRIVKTLLRYELRSI